jgi:hypothetical protein
MTPNILNTPFDEFPPPPPPPLPPHPTLVLKVYQTLNDVRAAGLGRWAWPCHGPFELSVRLQRNFVLLYKLRCRGCGRANGHIAYDDIPPDLRVRKGEEYPEPSKFANEERYA